MLETTTGQSSICFLREKLKMKTKKKRRRRRRKRRKKKKEEEEEEEEVAATSRRKANAVGIILRSTTSGKTYMYTNESSLCLT
uniref:Uncharacterized protein n=1 Tax=Vespula pensylvanica TaxID=30213 RepID=A0A834KUF6_VESPE|nr:hypothetical protein H0235_012929 [Vespula pensylvanica]